MDKWLERFAWTNFTRAVDVAHDLKTPLNISVLNLELLRMRVQKLVGESDEKLNEYSRAIDQELRRMARIFDAYFVYAVPPKAEEQLEQIEPDRIFLSVKPATWQFSSSANTAMVFAHNSRLRELMKLLVEGAGKIFSADSVVVEANTDGSTYRLTATGASSVSESDLGKLFKFYYTDATGNPNIAFATARLIAETYGGSLTLWDENGSRLVLDLQLPLADHRNES